MDKGKVKAKLIIIALMSPISVGHSNSTGAHSNIQPMLNLYF